MTHEEWLDALYLKAGLDLLNAMGKGACDDAIRKFGECGKCDVEDGWNDFTRHIPGKT
jgi:hypothetical protein